MRLTLRQLQLFCAIAQTGSTSTAGQKVALSQSAVSSALADLEHALGVLLFDRIGKRLTLNSNGKVLLPMARALLRNTQEIEEVFQGGLLIPVNLHLAASTTIGNYVLPALLASFERAWPRVNIELRIGNSKEVVGLASALEVDLGLIEGPCHDQELTVWPWIRDELVIVCAPNHPLLPQAGERLGVKQLRQAHWLLRESGSGTREMVEQMLLPHLHQMQKIHTLGSSEAIKNAVIAGLGMSCLSRFVVRDALGAGTLVQVPTTLPQLGRDFSLVHRFGTLSGSLRDFALHCGLNEEFLPKKVNKMQ